LPTIRSPSQLNSWRRDWRKRERQQDNGLIVVRFASAAAIFDAHFERMGDMALPIHEFEPAAARASRNEGREATMRQRVYGGLLSS
jgi:hypothetical protein